ncbi:MULTISPECIES: bifunctional DNA primase/polymerase [Saccharothrix]|uniref:bifunctional DNA primase/polymerase n=1 Tax=Saccharothrix TaxID=2071 RepID=UPI00093B7EBC|nr:bifunctional DNA primase/polymerase [Saccharothrix sp. CB00851]OKI15445.1 hypothetical protein A6A25_14150 [Saccharothrix sp. CB00851]
MESSIAPGSPARRDNLQAALDYAALGWPVVPGAVWHGGRFADPVDERPVTSPLLQPVEASTSGTELVRQWWSTPGLHAPNVFTVTGDRLGAFAVFDSLAEAIGKDPWFTARRTPVLAVQGMPLAYFLVRPPVPEFVLSDEARVLPDRTPIPLPPSALGRTAVIWLITPAEARDDIATGDELADLIHLLERRIA